MKRCPDCGRRRRLSSFGVKYRGPQGPVYSSYCRPCASLRSLRWQRENRERRNERERRRYREAKLADPDFTSRETERRKAYPDRRTAEDRR